jgi:hypothetical protein
LKLAAEDTATATADATGLPFSLPPAGSVKLERAEIELIRPYLETYAPTGAINEAWLLLAAVTFTAIFALCFSRSNVNSRS